jgi:hypothetical protein
MSEDVHRELASRMLEDARVCIKKGDAVQASEKLYKVAEEAVKVLAGKFELPEYEDAVRIGRWTTPLLFHAVERMVERLGREIRHYWDSAWTLHVEGFHEARLDVESVAERVEDMRELLRLVEREMD